MWIIYNDQIYLIVWFLIQFLACQILSYSISKHLISFKEFSHSYQPSISKVKVKVAQSCPTLRDLMSYIVHGILQARILSGQPFPSSGDFPNPEIEPKSPILRVDSSPAEPQAKPKDTGVGSLSLLQRIFLTQELNWGLMHCRLIFNNLSYQGSTLGLYPKCPFKDVKPNLSKTEFLFHFFLNFILFVNFT